MNNNFEMVSVKELKSIEGGRRSHSSAWNYGYQTAKGIKGGVVAYNILKTAVEVFA